MADKDVQSFEKMVARVFNTDGLWSCEFCFWIDCDDRICSGCNALRESLNEKVTS